MTFGVGLDCFTGLAQYYASNPKARAHLEDVFCENAVQLPTAIDRRYTRGRFLEALGWPPATAFNQ